MIVGTPRALKVRLRDSENKTYWRRIPEDWPSDVYVQTPTYMRYRTVSPDGEHYEVEAEW